MMLYAAAPDSAVQPLCTLIEICRRILLLRKGIEILSVIPGVDHLDHLIVMRQQGNQGVRIAILDDQ